MSETEKPKSYGGGSSTSHGYMVEWRLKPESAALASILPFNGVWPNKGWQQADYRITDMARLTGTEADKIIRPYVRRGNGYDRSQHGLVDRDVAEAIIACLKTSIKRELLDNVEWRIVRIVLKQSYSLDASDDEVEHEKLMNEVEAVLAEATDA